MRAARKPEKQAYQSPQVAIISLNSLCKIEASMCYNDERGELYGNGICDCGGDEACTSSSCHCESSITRLNETIRNFLKKLAYADERIEEIVEAFSDGEPVRTNKDITVYRYYGGESGKLGRWVSPVLYDSQIVRSKLSLPPENTCELLVQFILKAGAQCILGTAAPLFGQEGGGVQFFVHDPSSALVEF